VKITGPQLARRVEKWGKRLSDLGVAHWRIEYVALADELPGDTPEADACVQCSALYDNCRFVFRNGFLGRVEARELDETIIHEWLHVAMRNLDRVYEIPEKYMPEATYGDWTHRVFEERENLIDGLSKALYTLHSGEKPHFSP
jgi:hypothetical protein